MQEQLMGSGPNFFRMIRREFPRYQAYMEISFSGLRKQGLNEPDLLLTMFVVDRHCGKQ